MEPPEEPDTPDAPEEEPDPFAGFEVTRRDNGMARVELNLSDDPKATVAMEYGAFRAGTEDGGYVYVRLSSEQMREVVRTFIAADRGLASVDFQRELLESPAFYHRRHELIGKEVGRVLHQRAARRSSEQTPRLRYSDSTAYQVAEGKYGYVYIGRIFKPREKDGDGKDMPLEWVFVEGYGSTSDAARYDALLNAREINPACEPDERDTGEER